MNKRYIAVLVLVLLLLLLFGPVPYFFLHNMSELDQIQIEIVRLETEIGYHAGSPYNEEDVEVISIIENEMKEEFISDFRKIKSYQPNIGARIDCISGEAIRITYPNGDIELITDFGAVTVEAGEISNQTTIFDKEGFSELLDKYDDK